MRDGLDPELRRLGEQPRYALAEAARLGRLRPHTLRRWTRGYRYAGGLQPPVLRQASPAAGLSFFDLLEVVFLRAYRERGLSLQSIRRALDFTAENLSVDRPLLLKAFLHGGKDLFACFQSDAGEHGLINVSRRGQTAWPEVVEQYLEELDYEHDIAIRWWPEGRARNVLIDPRFEFGWPVVPSKNVRTELLAERWEAGERIAQIAPDFDISEEQVEDALSV